MTSIGKWYHNGMPPYTYVHFYSVLGMHPKLTWVMMIPRMQTLNQRVMVPLTYMKMHLLLHIYKYAKFQLDCHSKNMIRVCIRFNDSNGKAIHSYKGGQMDVCGLCLAHNNVKAIYNMFMRSWAISRSKIIIICSMSNIGGQGCNFMFNNLFIGVWCVIKCKHHTMHLHFIYIHCPS
jgi:hypothetical protein